MWLCVSSTAPGTQWLKNTQRRVVQEDVTIDLIQHGSSSDERLTPDCHEHSKSHGALIVKQMTDLCGYKHH